MGRGGKNHTRALPLQAIAPPLVSERTGVLALSQEWRLSTGSHIGITLERSYNQALAEATLDISCGMWEKVSSSGHVVIFNEATRDERVLYVPLKVEQVVGALVARAFLTPTVSLTFLARHLIGVERVQVTWDYAGKTRAFEARI